MCLQNYFHWRVRVTFLRVSGFSLYYTQVHAVAQWSLVRDTNSSEVRAPLQQLNPLLQLPSRLQRLQQLYSSSGVSSPALTLHTTFSPNTSPDEVEHSWPGEVRCLLIPCLLVLFHSLIYSCCSHMQMVGTTHSWVPDFLYPFWMKLSFLLQW